MKKLSLFLMLVMFGFGMMVSTTQAADITQAPDFAAESVTGPSWNARFAIAPYAQVVPDASYTFVGISHPSLATAHTSIGLVVEALGMTTVPNTASGRATVFTVHAGTTHRVFIVNQGHSTINLNNAAFTDSKTHIITTTDANQFGSIKVTGIGNSPTLYTSEANRPGKYLTTTANSLSRHDNISQLAMWGVVYQSSNGAGFALEFIGDMHDSNSGGCGNQDAGCYEATGNAVAVNHGGQSGGRGIN